MSPKIRHLVPFLLLCFCPTLLPGAELVTTAGKKINCVLVGIGDKKIDMTVDGRADSLPITQILQVDFAPFRKEATKEMTSIIELLDGSQFRVKSYKIKGKKIELELYNSSITKPLQLPLSQVYYLFREPDSLKLAADFQTLVRKRSKRDVMVVRKGENLDAIEGTFGEADATGDTIQFEIAGGVSSPIRMSRVLGIIFNQPPEGERPTTLCKLIDKSGNLFVLKAIQVAGDKLTWSTVTGVDVAGYALSDVARLDFSSGTLRYLSDLDPASVVATSTNEFVERFRKDTNLDGREISLHREKFPKGLTIPSRTILTYDVEGFREFRAVIGVDDELEADSVVNVKIEADGKPIFTQKITKKDGPKPVNLGIQNVKNLRLTVESELLDLGNQVSLGDARVIK